MISSTRSVVSRMAWLALPTIVLIACSSGSTSQPATVPATTASSLSTTVSTTTTTGAPASTSISPPAPLPTTTTAATTTSTAASTTTSTSRPPDTVADQVIGSSVEGRPITAVHRGRPGGRVVVVIGVIHGDEAAGLAITDRLQSAAVPDGIDLWIVPTMNPDGMAADDRHNADQVDLNRNFPYRWGPIGEPGDPEYAGPSAASEPETQAITAFLDEVRPELVIWYHQDLDRIAPGTGRDGRIRARYAALTDVPLAGITGGTYTGVAATWARSTLPNAVAFIVELGPTLSDAQADAHATAVLTVAGEL